MKKTVDVSIPLGPVHPCWKEPVRIKCETAGERVLRTEVELGYMKKGIERIMRGRPWQEVMFLAERVCGICSVVHNMVFIETMEEISAITVPPRAAYLRVIANELDRIASHLIANFSYCYTIEHETLAMYILNTRETVLDNLERLTGSRINTAYMIPGGVRFDLLPEDAAAMLADLAKVEEEMKRHVRIFETGPLIALRSRGIGVMTREEAVLAHTVGPTARASGVPDCDLRLRHPTYQALGFKQVTRTEGDNFARIMVRFQEVFQSIDLIRRCIETLPEGPIRGGGFCKAGETSYSGEAPRGELTYYVKTDEYGRVVDIAIRTPSIMNIEACAHSMIKDVTSIADVTSTFISSDPCVACNER
ncbi:nickel-dependent hydrogenase large subunit [Methanoculleus bourgensis]|jgi:energy-converting hydrogenase A subunit O|uniref:hydrogenase large subunit n=1 Tax=Methanoculleus bourgensis TaxID=83986 RepID=UPI0007BCBE4C|nr:nickel-dependent hydrogenase large subunit [Methanoculleus bourgensis]MBT0733258.1 nickel-dependent hydrogenase large subunit [Methanoculleus bourgensis]SAI88491.1 membrane-bound hydrogenase subunit ehaO [Methanoculleus bourgensis]